MLEVLIFCSLISVAPYYDCSEQWAIQIYDSRADYPCANIQTMSCVTFPNFIYWNISAHNQWEDACGYSLLTHELNHLKNPEDWEFCHWQERQNVKLKFIVDFVRIGLMKENYLVLNVGVLKVGRKRPT